MAKRVHFMGIAGSGCSATAAIAQAQGYDVSGCDPSQYSEYKAEILSLGIDIAQSHDPSHVPDCDLLIMSPAVEHFDRDNAEIKSARQANIPVMTWQQFSAEQLQKDKFVVAIAGTHGKSTATAMTALILEAAGFDPTVQLGAIVPAWQKNYRIGQSKYYVIEADEYKNNFLFYRPDILAITNIEHDHPDFFPTQADFVLAFEKLIKLVKPNGKILASQNVIGSLPCDENRLITVVEDGHFRLQIPGEFNLSNASLAAAVSHSLGIVDTVIMPVLENFQGIGRRFQIIGTVNSVIIIDDYGHHPTAISKTAAAARQKFPNSRIILTYQPHMFSRTKTLWQGFVETFQTIPIDQIYLVDIFAAREHDSGEVSSKKLAQVVSRPNVHYGGSLKEVEKTLLNHLRPHDIVINMGAGDIIGLSQWLMKDLAKKYGQ